MIFITYKFNIKILRKTIKLPFMYVYSCTRVSMYEYICINEMNVMNVVYIN